MYQIKLGRNSILIWAVLFNSKCCFHFASLYLVVLFNAKRYTGYFILHRYAHLVISLLVGRCIVYLIKKGYLIFKISELILPQNKNSITLIRLKKVISNIGFVGFGLQRQNTKTKNYFRNIFCIGTTKITNIIFNSFNSYKTISQTKNKIQ